MLIFVLYVNLLFLDLPEDHSNVLQEFGLKGYNKCNDEKLGNMKISGRDFNSLRGCQFLNDTVIDKYLELICKRSIERPEYRKVYFHIIHHSYHSLISDCCSILFFSDLSGSRKHEKLSCFLSQKYIRI